MLLAVPLIVLTMALVEQLYARGLLKGGAIGAAGAWAPVRTWTIDYCKLPR